MSAAHDRTEILIGREGVVRLRQRRVLLVGLGGVGGYVAEVLARSALGALTLVDHDVVDPSNLNRQLAALHSTIGQPKVAVMVERLRDIDPDLVLDPCQMFVQPEAIDALLDRGPFDYVADCIDSVTCKAALVAACQRRQVPVISALGAGNRIDASLMRIHTLAKVRGCGLGRALRSRLRRLGASLEYPVVASEETRFAPPLPHQPNASGIRPRATNGTIAQLPAISGVLLGGFIVQQLLQSD